MAVKYNPNPRKIQPGETVVEMNGRMYHKADSISAARWPYLQRYQAAWIHGTQAHDIHKVLGELWTLLQKSAFGECAVMVHNLRNSVADMTHKNRLPAAACLTMLFWNEEGEDVGVMSEDLMNRKLEDALNSGIDMEFFFVQALSCTPGFISASQQTNTLDNGSPKAKETVDALN